jgi:hypothetical protein
MKQIDGHVVMPQVPILVLTTLWFADFSQWEVPSLFAHINGCLRFLAE